MRKTWNNILLLIALCLCLTACTIRPRSVLSERQMRELLIDLHRADGALQVAGVTYQKDEKLAAYYASVLEKHGVTQAQFDSSLVWYTDNPNLFDKIYPSIIERLEAEHQIALDESAHAAEKNKQRKARLHELDSIMRIPRQPWQHIQMYEYKPDTLDYYCKI